MSFDKDTFLSSKSFAAGKLVRTVKGKREEYPFSLALINEDGGPVSVAPYPHRELHGRDKMGLSRARGLRL